MTIHVYTYISTNKIGERIGKVIEVDFTNGGMVINRRYLKIWIKVDVEKSLPAGFFFPHKRSLEQVNWIQFKYLLAISKLRIHAATVRNSNNIFIQLISRTTL